MSTKILTVIVHNRGGCRNAIEALIAQGADLDKRDQYGETPQEYAKRIGIPLVWQK